MVLLLMMEDHLIQGWEKKTAVMLQGGAQYMMGSWAPRITVTTVFNLNHLESLASLLKRSLLACYSVQ